MSETVGMKPIQNGQMYRQIFEAEVQLVNSLATSKATRRQKRLENEDVSRVQAKKLEGDKPVVNNALVGMDERQKTWATSMPNDWKTENPVLKRYKSVAQQKRVKGHMMYKDEDVVAALPDVVAPVSFDPNSAGRARTLVLVNKLTEGRMERHRAAFEDMEQEVSLLGKEIDGEMQKRSQETSDFLERQQDEIDRIMTSIDDQEVLQSFDSGGLFKVWEAVLEICKFRQESIRKLDWDLKQMEKRRRSLTFDILRKYFLIFERIAHLLPADVRKLMEVETQSLNEVLMENEVRLSEFIGLMVKHEFELERSLRENWTDKRNFWRTTKQNVLLAEFKEYMNSSEVTKPESASAILEKFYDEQEMLNNARKELIVTFKETFIPPKSHKSNVYQWNSAMGQFSKQLLAIQEKYMTLLHTEYERVCQNCLGELQVHKKTLIESQVCDKKSAAVVMERDFLPLVGKQQRVFEQILENMDTSLEDQNKNQFEEVKSLFKFSQGLAHVWDQHEAGLAQQERTMQTNLDANRIKNDQINQEREATLDMTIDKLRQETSEAGLKATLKQVMDILDRIRAGYDEFALQQEKLVKKYPTGVHQEFDKYDQNLLKFFGISRKNPADKKKPTAGAADAGGNSARPSKAPKDKEGATTDRDKHHGHQDTTRSTKTMKALAGVDGANKSTETKEQKMKRTVKEIIQMSTGVQFFVLSVAGSDGVIDTPDDSSSSLEQSNKSKGKGKLGDSGDGIELTEDDISESTVEAKDKGTTGGAADEQQFPEDSNEDPEDEEADGTTVHPQRNHLNTCALPRSHFQKVKREMRHHFLEQLEKWRKESDQRANSIVSAKTNELKNELQLKLHLHEPRAKRAEIDIHNVRAAELVMHSERVDRHIKGVNQTLNDLRKEFVDMSSKHDSFHDNFKTAIQALEAVFVNATKSQKLQEIQTQLKKEKGLYMDQIRSDLRSFRQKMDDTSQMLREANSRFIKGFKVFSEGGNFCVEEIGEYKGQLDRVSGQIEQTEGVIMADLESMESSRMDKANQVCSNFENKFKHHMADLTFIEKLSRWLTNTQVKIKTEASESNTQSQTLALLLSKIDRKINAIQHPSPDKENLTAIDLQEWLVTVFDTFNARAEYLNCLKVPVTQSQAAGNPSQLQPHPQSGLASMPTSLKRKTSRMQQMSTSNPGKVGFFESGTKKSQDESTMRLMKNIFNAQKTKLSLYQEASLAESGGGKTGDGGGGLGDEKSRATLSRRSTNMSDQSASGSKQRVSSGGQGLTGTTYVSTRRGSKGIRFDKKYLVFGDKSPEGTHFQANIQRILQYTLEGMLVVSDSYYRNKGLRAITRPQAIQDSFDSCADVIGTKLQNYQSQAENFYNNTLQEFRQQIRDLEAKVSLVPELVIKQFFQERIATLRDTKPSPELLEKSELLAKKRSEFEAKLHPEMGHPNRVVQLGQLDGAEQERHKEIVSTIDICNSGVNELLNRQAKAYCSDLAKLSEQLLLQYDGLLLIEDVNMGNFGTKELSTEELIRRKANGESLEEPVEQPVASRGRGNWEGIPLNTLATSDLDPNLQVVKSAVVSTMKSSDVHKTVDILKDKYFELFVTEFQMKAKKSENHFEHERIQERRWSNNWTQSVAKIKALY
ncbi:coiled-coil domain-containing protein 180-like isoform X2 [Symsagittifera roscoffensis]|uniref:coiled-coil domain-containing protein 180-like isoform X2 n=1 Tax=Symsagittifera roscoffensis TaxID=84072 RepID=UPI00307C2D50